MTESTRLIDPYTYIFSDITDIYKATSNAGIKVIVQPSSLVGSRRISAGTFEDYWEHIIIFQKKSQLY
jgi:hypothetical protein